MIGEACQRPGCSGRFDDDGFCDECGLRPAAATMPAASDDDPLFTEIVQLPPVRPIDPARASSAAGPGTSREAGSTSGPASAPTTSTRRSTLGAGLVKFAPIPERDPLSTVLDEPSVPERSRFCKNGHPAGRGRGDEPGLVKGSCPTCGESYCFRPPLERGVVVGGQYAVEGCIAHGGQGWIYLARDGRVDARWVVLKGLITAGDEDAIAAAIAERRFLASLKHPDVVIIYNFVEHDGDGYIVMEHVNGISLRTILEQRKAANGGTPDPMPVDQALGYLHGILPALGALHEQRLLFCDLKPDNVMQERSSLKLIDLGGAYRMDDGTSPVYGTAGYQAPEIADDGPSVESDLYTAGRTLAVLCTDFRGNLAEYRYTLPPAADVEAYARFDSLYQLISRATAFDRADRFHSADEMEAQVLGVLREVVSAQTGTPSGSTSSIFSGEGRAAPATGSWRALPKPLPNLDDVAAPLIVSVTGFAPQDAINALSGAAHDSTEAQLWIAALLLDLERYDDVHAALDEVAIAHPREWRTNWYRGLIELAAGDPEVAGREFHAVYRHLPGELAPKLALGTAAEAAGDLCAAVKWYGIVARTDPSLTSAVFGLARCSKAIGDCAGAVAALEQIPQRSSAFRDAQLMEIEVLLDGDYASVADLHRSEEIVERLSPNRENASPLIARIFEAALTLVDRDRGVADASASLFGRPLTERGVRLGLESTYRSLARHESGDEKVALVDRANAVRPVSWL